MAEKLNVRYRLYLLEIAKDTRNTIPHFSSSCVVLKHMPGHGKLVREEEFELSEYLKLLRGRSPSISRACQIHLNEQEITQEDKVSKKKSAKKYYRFESWRGRGEVWLCFAAFNVRSSGRPFSTTAMRMVDQKGANFTRYAEVHLYTFKE